MTSAAVTLDRTSSVAPPAVRRNCNATSPSPCTAAVTWGAPVARVERTVHPSLRCGSTPAPENRARAVRMKFPSSCFHTKWKSSRSSHMLAPDPAIVYSSRDESSQGTGRIPPQPHWRLPHVPDVNRDAGQSERRSARPHAAESELIPRGARQALDPLVARAKRVRDGAAGIGSEPPEQRLA